MSTWHIPLWGRHLESWSTLYVLRISYVYRTTRHSKLTLPARITSMCNHCIFCIHITRILHCDKPLTHSIKLKINTVTRISAMKPDSLAYYPQTTFITSLIHRDFGLELFGRQYCWPAVTDSPRRRQRPLSSVFVKNCITVHDFCIRTALTISPFSTVQRTRCRFDYPKSNAFSTSLHWRLINRPHLSAVQSSREHSRPNSPCCCEYLPSNFIITNFTNTILLQICRAKQSWYLEFSFLQEGKGRQHLRGISIKNGRCFFGITGVRGARDQ
jgi:hypothetical protein